MSSDDDLEDFDLDSIDESIAPPPADETVNINKPLEPSHMIGHFRLQKILGRGGMGEVWLATDTQLERQVAIKLMRPEYVSNTIAIKRFQREARAIAKLNHPNIVQVHMIGWHNNTIYMVIELVEGETLSTYLTKQGHFDLVNAVSCILQTVEGLSFAYSKGVVHRDIKPGNLMLTEKGIIKITDFGLAKLMLADTAMTQEGTTLGSPNYMSPEQAKGSATDHRSDMYSLGVTFYHLLTGELPYKADTPMSVMLMQIQDPLPEPKELLELADGKAFRIIKKMTEKKPEDRYQDYNELAADLVDLAPDAHTFIHIQNTSTRTKSVSSSALRPKNIWGMVAAIVLFFVVIAAAGVYFMSKIDKQQLNNSVSVPENVNIGRSIADDSKQPAAVNVETDVTTPTANQPALQITLTPTVTFTPKPTIVPTKRPAITYTPIVKNVARKKTVKIVPMHNEQAVPAYYDPQGKRECTSLPVGAEVEVFDDKNKGFIGVLNPNKPKQKIYILEKNTKAF